jgi:hypothetical protein
MANIITAIKGIPAVNATIVIVVGPLLGGIPFPPNKSISYN